GQQTQGQDDESIRTAQTAGHVRTQGAASSMMEAGNAVNHNLSSGSLFDGLTGRMTGNGYYSFNAITMICGSALVIVNLTIFAVSCWRMHRNTRDRQSLVHSAGGSDDLSNLTVLNSGSNSNTSTAKK